MITEKDTGSQQGTQRATQTPQIDKQITNARWPPTMHSILPAGCSQSQLPPRHETRPQPYAGPNPVTRASRLPSTIPDLGLTLTCLCTLHPDASPVLGPGLNLGFCNVSTGAQSSYLLTRLLPSTRRAVLPRGTEIPDEPPNVMHRAHISEPTETASPPQ